MTDSIEADDIDNLSHNYCESERKRRELESRLAAVTRERDEARRLQRLTVEAATEAGCIVTVVHVPPMEQPVLMENARAASAEARLERYREALLQIKDDHEAQSRLMDRDWSSVLGWAQDIARAALEQEP